MFEKCFLKDGGDGISSMSGAGRDTMAMAGVSLFLRYFREQ
jgi:hypothetical protein